MWTFIESGVAIIVGNLPCCRQGFAQLFGHGKSLVSKQSNYVFSANRTKRGGDPTTTTHGDDELRLWPNALAPSYETGIVHNDKNIQDESLSSTSLNDDEYRTKDHRVVNMTTEVYLTSRTREARGV